LAAWDPEVERLKLSRCFAFKALCLLEPTGLFASFTGRSKSFNRAPVGSASHTRLASRNDSRPPSSKFEPEHFQDLAGLVCYYNSAKFHYLYLSQDETIGKHLRVMSFVPDLPQADAFTPLIPIPPGKRVHLRVEVGGERMNFGYRVEGVDGEWRWLPEQFDASILSDECIAPGQAHFTGAFVGMACQDLAGTRNPADFDFFQYEEGPRLEFKV
jgi:xylan 1,4-beta-xylosidase